jgi:hypothetical protein
MKPDRLEEKVVRTLEVKEEPGAMTGTFCKPGIKKSGLRT